MKRLSLAIFLWFWLTMIAVAVAFLLLLAHSGLHGVWLVRLTLHDLMIFTLAGGIFSYFISRYLTKPLYKLGEAASSIAEGRLDTRVDPSLLNRRDEIAGLARNFDRMAERIEALVTGQRALLGDVSHELRSPLSRLIGGAESGQARPRRRDRGEPGTDRARSAAAGYADRAIAFAYADR